MWQLIVIIIIFIILSIFVGSIFLSDFLALAINILVLWFILLRSYFEVNKKKLIKTYFAALTITFLMFIFLKDSINIPILIWQIWFVTIFFIIAEIIQGLTYLYKEHEVEKKFNKWLNKKKK
jgi:hypothetical protein